MNTSTTTTRPVFSAATAELFEAYGITIDVVETPIVLQREFDSRLQAGEVEFDEFMRSVEMLDDHVVRGPRRFMIQHTTRQGHPIVVIDWAIGVRSAHILCDVGGRAVVIHEGPVRTNSWTGNSSQVAAFDDACLACGKGQGIDAFKNLLDAYCNE